MPSPPTVGSHNKCLFTSFLLFFKGVHEPRTSVSLPFERKFLEEKFKESEVPNKASASSRTKKKRSARPSLFMSFTKAKCHNASHYSATKVIHVTAQ